jgi:hypothetical protein
MYVLYDAFRKVWVPALSHAANCLGDIINAGRTPWTLERESISFVVTIYSQPRDSHCSIEISIVGLFRPDTIFYDIFNIRLFVSRNRRAWQSRQPGRQDQNL